MVFTQEESEDFLSQSFELQCNNNVDYYHFLMDGDKCELDSFQFKVLIEAVANGEKKLW